MVIALALIPAMSWGSLPITMKVVVQVMDPLTVVFYRFFLAALGLGTILALKHQPPPRDFFRHPRWLLWVVVAQQTRPGMMLASVFILKDKMRRSQMIGLVMLLCGLVMFFNTNLVEIFTRLNHYTWGVILGVSAALVWVGYGVMQ